MPHRLSCPSCSKSLSAPSEARGRKVRCSGCGWVFRVPAEEAEPDPGRWGELLEPAPPAPVANETLPEPVPDPPRARPGPPRRRSDRPRPLGDFELMLVSGGVKGLTIGVLGLIAMSLGFQPGRKLSNYGDAASTVCAILIVVGLAMISTGYARRYWRPALKMSGVCLSILLALVLSARLIFGPPGGRVVFVNQPNPVPGPTPPPPPAFANQPPGAPPWSASPNSSPGGEARSGFARPAPPSVVDSVRVRIEGLRDSVAGSGLSAKLKRLCDPGGSSSVEIRSRNGEVEAIVGPVRDVEACRDRVDFGRILRLDAEARFLAIEVEAGS